MSTTQDGAEAGYTPEEMEAEREEWVAYVPEMLLALEAGHLDSKIRVLYTALMQRREKIGTTIKIVRKSAASSSASSTTAANTVSLPEAFATTNDVITGVYDPSLYGTSHIHCGGSYYAKFDIHKAGTKFIANGLGFELVNSRKYPRCRFELKTINRTRAIVRCVHVPNGVAGLGDEVSIPIDWLVRSMREVRFPADQL